MPVTVSHWALVCLWSKITEEGPCKNPAMIASKTSESKNWSHHHTKERRKRNRVLQMVLNFLSSMNFCVMMRNKQKTSFETLEFSTGYTCVQALIPWRTTCLNQNNPGPKFCLWPPKLIDLNWKESSFNWRFSKVGVCTNLLVLDQMQMTLQSQNVLHGF